MNTRITVPNYLREYLIGKYCNLEERAVHFPDSSDLYHILFDLLEKRPANIPVDQGNIEIFLPNRSVGKNPMTYNYLSQRGQKILIRNLEIKMWAEVHDMLDEQKHTLGINYIDGVHTFMNKYGINSLSEDAFLKNYYRWRAKVRQRSKKREYIRKK